MIIIPLVIKNLQLVYGEYNQPSMKPVSFIFLVFISFFCIPFDSSSEESSQEQHSFIFKPDGTTHCESKHGINLDSMELELSSNDIPVFATRKGHDGREGIALCGKPTGQINIYEVNTSDVARAISLGFHELPR